ncbi:hypothetical protein CQW23_32451 [Capsicum baccatum]|uniref:Uncharacterized protein n=1 Tax=Capsicum baccatum TaxID=33114 RepID=A0A2G2V4M8_CAPBA|nr:hypothetical protein CQW23_32451 [Capsicum baccatum]
MKAAIKIAGMQQKALVAVEKMEKRSSRYAKPITIPFNTNVNETVIPHTKFVSVSSSYCVDKDYKEEEIFGVKDRANQFYVAIRKYYPGLKDGSLEPGYAGIRPKLFGPEEDPTDFVVQINGSGVSL